MKREPESPPVNNGSNLKGYDLRRIELEAELRKKVAMEAVSLHNQTRKSVKVVSSTRYYELEIEIEVSIGD